MSDLEVRFSGGAFDRLLAAWAGLSPDRRGMIILLGILFLAAVCVGVWVLFVRKPRRRKHHHHHGHHSSSDSERSEAATAGNGDSSGHPSSGARLSPFHSTAAEDGQRADRPRRKRRRSRGDRFPRNPTLAETGGLPPVRQGDPPEILP